MAEDATKPDRHHPQPSSGSSHPSLTPDLIGPYKIEGLYRSGGMSLVYTGTDPETQQVVAIKILKPKYQNHPEALKRFKHEAQVLAMADHPNIVALHQQGKWISGDYLVMEFIPGESLHRILTYKPLSLRRSVEIVLEIAYALCHLHTLGIIHRDLKPENILLKNGSKEEVKLIDLGVARNLHEIVSDESDQSVRLIGTPIYMSPEQRFEPHTVSFPSDVYSLGIIAYELALGKLSHGQIHLALAPKGLQPILSKALQPTASDRYQDVVDLISDLSHYLDSSQLEIDAKATDPFSELTHQLYQTMHTLNPSLAPQWSMIDVGIACEQGRSIYGLYFDFFTLPDGDYAILLAEPDEKGVAGLIYTGVLRGMVRSLSKIINEPSELVASLNDLIYEDAPHQVYKLGYLLLSPAKKEATYISCGKSCFWHIATHKKNIIHIDRHNPPLGHTHKSPFTEHRMEWSDGDLFTLGTEALAPLLGHEIEKPEALLGLSPQQQADQLLRKTSPSTPAKLERRPRAIITVLKQNNG
ncbi:MAG: serine/threonine protein kinase [Oceanospirillaceae bacterium]|nr:serine/threonine protein kinase [Oceanospirillaceae bacterium]